MVRWYPVHEAVIISFLSQHYKLGTNCAVRMTHLWTSVNSEFQLELILATLHHCLISYMYNLLWWVHYVNKVDEELGDVDVQFMHCHGPWKTFNWQQGGDSCYALIKNIVLCRHLLQLLEELTESVVKIVTKLLLRLQKFICEQLLI